MEEAAIRNGAETEGSATAQEPQEPPEAGRGRKCLWEVFQHFHLRLWPPDLGENKCLLF